MVTKRMVLVGTGMVLMMSVCALFAGEDKTAAGSGPAIIVGTYDSRAVAVAYAHSELWRQKMQEMQKSLDEAKAAGDANKVKEIEQWGPTQQRRFHMQGFGTASVGDILECIKNDIPGIAKDAGVDIIINKWDITFKNPSAKTIDITQKLIAPFKPDERTLTMIRDMMTKQPISNEVLEKMDPRE